MRGRIGTALLAGALLLLLSACGGGGGGGVTPTQIAPPTGLTATPGDGVVDLHWQASTSKDVARYNVYQGTSSGKLSKVGEVAGDAVSYRASGLTNDTEYFFAVDAEDSGGKRSAKSNEVRATPTGPGNGGGDPDPVTPPTVVTTSPSDGATGIGTNSNISITFSKAMDEPSTEAAFSVAPALDCEFRWLAHGTRLTCVPKAGLDPNQAYDVTIGTGAQDRNGNTLATSKEFTFTTTAGTASVCTFGESKFGACTFGP